MSNVNQFDRLVVEVAADAAFSPVLHTIESVQGWRSTNELMAVGSFSFNMEIAELHSSLKKGSYLRCRVYRPGESAGGTIEYIGVIENVEDEIDPSGGRVAVRGVGRGHELTIDEADEIEIHEWETVEVNRVHLTRPGADVLPLEDINSGLAYDENDADTFDNLKLYFWETSPDTGYYWIYWCTDAPHRAIRPIIPAGSTDPQTAAATLFSQPYDGTGWWNASNMADGTAVGGVPFSQTGWITWDRNPQERPISQEGVFGYWGRIYANADLDNFHITGFEAEQAAEHSAAITAVASYLPAGWSMAAGSPTNTLTPQMLAGYGITPFELFYQLAQQSHEVFRIDSAAGKVQWLNAAVDNGLAAKVALDPEDDTDTTAVIVKMKRKQISNRVVTRIKPRGAGDDLLACPTLASLTDADVTALALLGFTADVANNIIINSDLETALGYQVLESVPFPHIHALRGGVGNNRQTSRQLAYSAVAWLRGHTTDTYYSYSGQLINARHEFFYEGAECQVTYDIEDDNGNLTEAVDETLIISKSTYQPNPAGVEYYQIEFTRTLYPLPEPDRLAAEMEMDKKRQKLHPKGVFGGRVIDNEDHGLTGGNAYQSIVSPSRNLPQLFIDHIQQTTEAHDIPGQIASHAADRDADHYMDDAFLSGRLHLGGPAYEAEALYSLFFDSDLGILVNWPMVPNTNSEVAANIGEHALGTQSSPWEGAWVDNLRALLSFHLQQTNVTERIINCDTVVREGGPLPTDDEAANFPVNYHWVSTTLNCTFRHLGGGRWVKI